MSSHPVLLSAVPSIGLAARSACRSAAGVRQFVKVDAPVVALTHVRVIDGTGAPARADQTVVIRDGYIAAVGANVCDSRGRHGHRCDTGRA